MLIYNDTLQTLSTPHHILVRDLSESKVLNRLGKLERMIEIRKFCSFKFNETEIKFV